MNCTKCGNHHYALGFTPLDAFVWVCNRCESYINEEGQVYPKTIGIKEIDKMGFPENSTIEKNPPGYVEDTKLEPSKSVKIEETLIERRERYGKFKTHAQITQNIKFAMQSSPNWEELDAPMREALEMTAHKIGRILNGDPTYKDSWHDIIGYIRLVEQELDD